MKTIIATTALALAMSATAASAVSISNERGQGTQVWDLEANLARFDLREPLGTGKTAVDPLSEPPLLTADIDGRYNGGDPYVTNNDARFMDWRPGVNGDVFFRVTDARDQKPSEAGWTMSVRDTSFSLENLLPNGNVQFFTISGLKASDVITFDTGITHDTFGLDSISATPVPLPAPLALLLMGMASLFGVRHMRRAA